MIAKKKTFIFLIMNAISHVQKIQLVILMIIPYAFAKIIFSFIKKEVYMIAFQVIKYALQQILNIDIQIQKQKNVLKQRNLVSKKVMM
jgi:hypothetical protein